MSLPFWAWQKSPPLRVFRQSYAEESLEQLFGRKIDLPTVSALKNPYSLMLLTSLASPSMHPRAPKLLEDIRSAADFVKAATHGVALE